MLKRNIVDDLYSIVIKRYLRERPEVILTNDRLDSIWFSLCSKLNHEGKEKAYEYARNAKLLW